MHRQRAKEREWERKKARTRCGFSCSPAVCEAESEGERKGEGGGGAEGALPKVACDPSLAFSRGSSLSPSPLFSLCAQQRHSTPHCSCLRS